MMKTTYTFLDILSTVILVVLVMGNTFGNVSYKDQVDYIKKMEVICEANGGVKEFDKNGELVCNNGGSFKYK